MRNISIFPQGARGVLSCLRGFFPDLPLAGSLSPEKTSIDHHSVICCLPGGRHCAGRAGDQEKSPADTIVRLWRLVEKCLYYASNATLLIKQESLYITNVRLRLGHAIGIVCGAPRSSIRSRHGGRRTAARARGRRRHAHAPRRDPPSREVRNGTKRSGAAEAMRGEHRRRRRPERLPALL